MKRDALRLLLASLEALAGGPAALACGRPPLLVLLRGQARTAGWPRAPTLNRDGLPRLLLLEGIRHPTARDDAKAIRNELRIPSTCISWGLRYLL